VQIVNHLDEFPRGESVSLTLGTFDGVHRGHRKIIERTVAIARERQIKAVLLTFDPHPREVIGRRGDPTYLLTTIEERIALLDDTGIDICVVLPFTRDLSVLDAATFFEEYIVRRLHTAHLIVGVDHAFGRGRAGTAPELEKLGVKHGVDVTVVSEMMLEGIKVSSTAVRNALLAGRVRQAKQFLGSPYLLRGIVVRGEGVGSSLGFPTANIEIQDGNKLLPQNGVYIVAVRYNGETREGIMNIGRRPTLSKQMHISVEVHIFTTSGNLYGQFMQIALLDRLRDEIQFENRDQLMGQIRTDVAFAQELLAKHKTEYNNEQFNFIKE
jgi:riboflavin kinase/FMN adenylyltransferase